MKKVKTFLYWLVQATWGFPTFLLGTLIAIAMLITSPIFPQHKPHRFGYSVYFYTPWMRGCGFEMGAFFFLSEDCKDSLSMRQHEHGHGIQTLWFGPFMLFIVSIPSAIRFWYRGLEYKSMSNKLAKKKITKDEFTQWCRNRPSYDSIWFEGLATSLGQKYFSQE